MLTKILSTVKDIAIGCEFKVYKNNKSLNNFHQLTYKKSIKYISKFMSSFNQLTKHQDGFLLSLYSTVFKYDNS